jgi:hypothetical protein
MAIYFVQAGEGPAVKIGKADDVAARLRELQCGNHLVLRVLRVVEGGRREEAWLHARYAHKRLRGEWFEFCAEMLTIEVQPIEAALLPVTPLKSFLARYEGGAPALAAALGVRAQAVYRYASGERFPRVRHLRRIVEISKGELSPSDLLPAAAPVAEAARPAPAEAA